MVSTLEDRAGSGNGKRKFSPCPGEICKTSIAANQPLCSRCMAKLPRSLRVRIEAAIADPESLSEDELTMLVQSCTDELKQQRVEQVQVRRNKRRA